MGQPQRSTETDPITAKNYHARALAFATQAKARPDDLSPTITPGTPECVAWVKYFDHHLNWRPYVLTMMLNNQCREMTVPAQWPEWFDSSYRSS